jgi:hypothetical protein
MDSGTEGITKLLGHDKRKADRVIIPLGLFFFLPQDQSWTGPLQINDIGGHGLKFAYDRELEAGTELNLKITFPEPSERAVNAKAKVAWCKLKNPTTHFIGVEITSMPKEDRKRYVQYICEKIILTHLTKAETS